MGEAGTEMSVYDRVLAVIQGRKPDHIPFCDRLELWRTALIRQGRLPAEYEGLSLIEAHRKVGMGQLKFVVPHDFCLRGVELTISVDGHEVSRETDPVTARWPVMEERVRADRPGATLFEFMTPVGALSLRQVMLPEAVIWAQTPYLDEHPVKEPEDFDTVRWIIEHIEVVPRFDRIQEAQAEIGDYGFVVPRIDRIPFQEVLIDLVGEVNTFYALNDDPARVHGLLGAIDELRVETAGVLAPLQVPYVEFGDNVTGHMTNPRLFAEYAVPEYQHYAELYHAQGKKVGSHLDGELKPLLGQLRDCGLDVIESVSPAPLTECSFDELWEAIGDSLPIMWGVIPSPLLEEREHEDELHEFVDHVLKTVGGAPIILGVSDMVLGNNLIERVEWAAERIYEHAV
ncbi:MAG: uroporphyrinogen decarboxylase family protein [Acidimicrobiales bacterium]|jgi:hypothetical protein